MPGTPLDIRATKMKRNSHSHKVFNLEERDKSKNYSHKIAVVESCWSLDLMDKIGVCQSTKREGSRDKDYVLCLRKRETKWQVPESASIMSVYEGPGPSINFAWEADHKRFCVPCWRVQIFMPLSIEKNWRLFSWEIRKITGHSWGGRR